jgi:hypothetical protein
MMYFDSRSERFPLAREGDRYMGGHRLTDS